MLSKEELLRRTNSGLNVFRYYIPGNWHIGRNFLNPLYNDTKASCNVFFDRNSRIYRIKDFGNNDYSGDCFFYVGKLKGIDCTSASGFVEILKIINNDLSLGLSEEKSFNLGSNEVKGKIDNPTYEKRIIRPYSFKEQSFSTHEIEFWSAYDITSELLKHYKVYSIKEFSSENSEGKPYSFYSSTKEPIFGYKGKKHLKLYRPNSKLRFLYGGDPGENYCFGLEQLPAKGDTVFVTGGEKDVLSLAAKGFNAICFNSETTIIPTSIIHKLSFRFKHIVLLYDSDDTGIESSLIQIKQLSEYGVKRLLLPLSGTKSEKDISDYFALGNSRNDFQKLFLNLLDTIYGDTLTMLKSCEIDFNNPPAKALEIVSAGDVPLGTQGNILCVTGGEGTGKSNYVAALLAGSIREENILVDTLGLDVYNNPKKRAVLLYDTEQSEVQLFKNMANLLRRAKQLQKPDELKAFCLTGMSRKERLLAIVNSMDKFYYEFGGIHMVVIDGIADLVYSANDEAESIRVIDELYRLAGIYQTCIVCVLHYVPNGLKLRGHLGSELQRKASAILSIEADNDPSVSVMKAIKVREGSPLDVPLMQFSWDKEMGMHVYKGEKPREEKEKRKEIELANIARDIFEEQPFLAYIDLCDKLQQVMDVKERTAKSYIRYMREKEIILKDPSNTNYYIFKKYK
ncbi:AAA family ATPase [Petrimonas sp.]|uniref:AAA family ATPase n=1 Tax=Petrimonas sp. TaxID=2023866 RepID=UPI003F512DD9